MLKHRIFGMLSSSAIPATLGSMWLVCGLSYSMLFAVYPAAAKKKGLNSSDIGLIIGIFELAAMIASSLIGTFLTHLGPKFVSICGTLAFGYSAALFAFLDWSPGGNAYFAMCLLVRVFQGAFLGSVLVSNGAILFKMYPNNFATVLAILETTIYAGIMIGPLVGNLLGDLGGIILPFSLLAALAFGTSIASICIFTLSKHVRDSASSVQMPEKGSVASLLKIPIVILIGIIITSFFTMNGYFLSTLSLLLTERYSLSSARIGFVFLLLTVSTIASSVLWGCLGDKKPVWITPLLAVGLLLCSTSFIITGPAPFLHTAPVPLWLAIFVNVPLGVGYCTQVMAARRVKIAVLKAGYPESLHTYGLITGFYNTSLLLGTFAGPSVGGLATDLLGYEWTFTVGAFIAIFLATILIIRRICHLCLRYFNKKGNVTDETVELQGKVEK